MAQEKENSKADKAFTDLNYAKAIKLYNKKDRETSAKFLARLGDSYYFNGKYEEANIWYKKLLELDEEASATYYFRYALGLKTENEYEESNKIMQKLMQLYPESDLAKINADQQNYLDKIEAESLRYSEVKNLDFNTENSDFGSFVQDSTVYFASANTERAVSRKIHLWTGEAFSQIYKSRVEVNPEDGELPEVVSILPKTGFNYSTPIFSKDGQTLYYTRNTYQVKKEFIDEDKINILKIYKAVKDGEDWVTAEELPFNSNDYSVAHPSLSADEKTLYFVSDMPGGFGESDIYSVAILEKGNFGEPVNLGPQVNTEARESFPFISSEGNLYFSSTGHAGLGGLDVFQVKLSNNSQSDLKAVNLGNQINSPYDDFAYSIDDSTGKGQFSSNRPGGKGKDDIYSFKQKQSLNCQTQLAIRVIDAKGKIIQDATVKNVENTAEANFQKENNLHKSTKACVGNIVVLASAPGFAAKELFISRSNTEDMQEFTVVLTKNPQMSIAGQDLNQLLQLNEIYFELDKAEIRTKAEESLDKIASVMLEMPTIKVEIGSHTDSRADDAYNLELSQRRATATRNYLIAKGISADRLTAKGFGETKLLNKCTNETKCSAKEHQLNRRSEFRVISE